MPLADQIRPEVLSDVVGQSHLLAPGRPLRRIADAGTIPNMIFYGPPGTGKTTVARILAKNCKKRLHRLNGTNTSLADIKQVVSELDSLIGQNGIVLYLDEIQYLNKKQQQSLLEYLEDGRITLIASTTENPYFYIYNAILSRCTVFEFRSLTVEEICPVIARAFQKAAPSCHPSDDVIRQIAVGCGGDVRKAINTVELAVITAPDGVVSVELAKELSQRSVTRYDRDGDEHYDLLSALQKSIRGSDENAAVFYLARLLEAGDLLSPCRRLLVIAAEDIGLAYPQAIPIVKACVDSAIQLGLPEGRIPLANAVILLATSPKSNSAYLAMARAMEDVKSGRGVDFPRALQNCHYDGAGNEQIGQNYQYPHDYPGHYVKQQYLPNDLVNAVYYHYGDNKTEQLAKQYWMRIKERKE